MAHERLAGLLYIILGLMLIIFPIFSSALISVIIGFALVCFGMAAMSLGFVFGEEFENIYSYLSILIGFISLLFGIMFMFFLNALTFLTSLQFYIVGIIMMAYGIVGLLYLSGKQYTIYSAIMLILGILTVVIAAFLASQPILIAVLLGVTLIVEGAFFIVIGRSMKLIETYG